MKSIFKLSLLGTCLALSLNSCSTKKKTPVNVNTIEKTVNLKSPSDVLPFFDKWKILLGDGTRTKDLINFQKEGFFYTKNDGKTDWIVYKTPNSGTTSKTSSNTRSELHQKDEWTTEAGGKLTGTLKVAHVSVSGDARVAASHSVVVGQIHSAEGHKNEPLKIYYKKFPGHTKGSVFWNYEINTNGESNKGRWDFSTPVWGHNMFVVGETPNTPPQEPADGITLGEEFSYEINVYEGIMYLTFKSDGHETKTFTKSLIKSDFTKKADVPQQIQDIFFPMGQDGTEKPNAYKGDLNYFKQGAYPN